MKPQKALDALYQGRPAYDLRERHLEVGPSADSGPQDALPHQTTQAERAVMHPERYDLEWRYWRGHWAGL